MQSLAEKAEKVGSCRERPATGSLLSLSACQVSRELLEKRGSRGGSLSPGGDETLSMSKRIVRALGQKIKVYISMCYIPSNSALYCVRAVMSCWLSSRRP